ncbi:MAG: DNA gyrase subunit A [Deltaproteobacteria bacterium]|jgi:DNA gyrase subunit A|nr:DNA gyrase subunit A [Deltaproteobacteria bacterium]
MTLAEENFEVSIEEEMKKSYMDYAMSVIIGRALPDVRDGLKPVHRRILFAMNELKNDWNKPYKKSARVVGDVIGKYHPHGDTAVYDTIVRMAQTFSLRYLLVDGQGNFGSVDGDSPAAMRYTEVRMSRMAHELLEDLEKETVDFVPNYDGSMTEPSVLPARVPNLIINGSTGIAVGMATNIPPHNLGEIIDAITALIDNPDISIDGLMEYVPGPDFPTYGMLYGVTGARQAYMTGRGTVRIRARAVVETVKRTDTQSIIVSEIPYQVNKAKLIEKISGLIKEKRIDGIQYVRDESDRTGMRIVIALKKDRIGIVILNQLYKFTQMESTFGIILLAIVNGRPELLNLKEILVHYVEHRKEIVTRRTRHELRKAEARAHILEGLKIAIDHLDDVVAMIRSSKTPRVAKDRLIEQFELSEIQAQAILDMRLQRLTGMERDKIIAEYKEVIKCIAQYKEILSSERLVLGLIKEELAEMRTAYGDKRRTEIVETTEEIELEDMIIEEDMVVTISHTGYIKRTAISLYESQHRGGKGRKGMLFKDEDFVEHLFVASTHDMFLFFTNKGRMYWSKVHELPHAGRMAKGKAIVNLLALSAGEKLATVLAIRDFEPGHFIVMATKNGLVKKTDVMAYSHPRTGGIIAINLVENDELIAARITDGTQNIFLGSCQGKAIRFHESKIRSQGRVSRGVIGMRLSEGDWIVGMEILSDDQTLVTVTENGYGKRTATDEYSLTGRGCKGVISIKTTDRNGLVVALLLVADEDDLMLMTDHGRIIRMPVKDISIIGRNTQGVRLIGMSEAERVTGAARLAEKE